ncbi:hypothetical protein NIES4075_73140 [Tolypothrix sp. NIES-4075]|nr:hypothetical protein NIES4075_73140 [Tolypothrix sp. NIES-4075]
MNLPDPGTLPTPKPANPCSASPCSSKMSDDLDDLKDKLEFIDIQVTVFKQCDPGTGRATFEQQTIKTIKALQAQESLKFARIAKLEALQCENNCIATVPEWWQIRPEAQRPQLIAIFVERKPDKSLGNDYYSLTIPHPNSNTAPNKAPLSSYKKGSCEGILTLKDNSKVIVNAFDKEAVQKVLEEISKLIDPKMLTGSFQKIGQRKGQNLKEITVELIRLDYYPQGAKDMKPKWIKNFK